MLVYDITRAETFSKIPHSGRCPIRRPTSNVLNPGLAEACPQWLEEVVSWAAPQAVVMLNGETLHRCGAVQMDEGAGDSLGAETIRRVALALIGNKTDLEAQREVPMEAAQKFAAEHGLLFLETSALDAGSVGCAFETLLAEVMRRMRDSATVKVVEMRKAPPGPGLCEWCSGRWGR